MLTVTVEDLGEVVILRCVGRMVSGNETAILCAAVQQHGRNVVLDLREVDAIDAAGIGSLISLQAAGIYLRLKNLTEPVREVLRVTKLESVFETCESQMARVVFDEGAARSGSMGRVDAGSAAIAD